LPCQGCLRRLRARRKPRESRCRLSPTSWLSKISSYPPHHRISPDFRFESFPLSRTIDKRALFKGLRGLQPHSYESLLCRLRVVARYHYARHVHQRRN
jgi:hypothetical protein